MVAGSRSGAADLPPPLADEWALRRLALLYAQAVDRNEPDLFASLFTEDAVVEGPGFRFAGYRQLHAVPQDLARKFRGTMHCVFNHTATIEGDEARGETYCIAYHGVEGSGGPATLEWAIRYQDRYTRLHGGWRFTYRQLIVQWTRTTAVDPAPPA